MKLLRNIFLPLLLVLGLAAGYAVAQNITKSVQLSQDSSGPIGYDTSGGVYFPGHILSNTRVAPAPTVTGATCGTTAPAITGTDFAGTVTVGSSATTSCVVTFGTAFVTAPTCVVSPKSTILVAFSFATSTTALTVTQTSTASNTFTYICSSLS